MPNAAYTNDYLLYRKKQEAIFCADFLTSEKTLPLSPQYQLRILSYRGNVGGYNLHATRNELLSQTGHVLYTYQNINDDCEFHKIIQHSDGSNYLIFRTDLYGYSVLNLETGKDFHYIPSDSFPKGEMFIWTDVFYNADNNMLAVSGCYWACPFGTLILDFTHPLEEPQVIADVQAHLEDGYDRYDDVDFAEWRGTDLVLCAWDCQTGKKLTISLTKETYGEWLKKELCI